MLLTFSKFHYIFLTIFHLLPKKNIHLVLSKSLLYALIFGRNMHKDLIFFIIFVTNDIFKIFFTERNLIRYYYFINNYIVYRNRAFMLMKFVFFNFSIIKIYIFLSVFTHGFKIFYIFLIYNFPLLWLK